MARVWFRRVLLGGTSKQYHRGYPSARAEIAEKSVEETDKHAETTATSLEFLGALLVTESGDTGLVARNFQT